MATTKKIIQKDAQGNVIEVDIGANATNITQDSTHRFVTDAEKTTWNAKQNAITIDTALSSSSTNPVQNKVVNTALAGKASSSHTHSNYVNQNAFSNVKVGNTIITADNTTDTLTLAAGNNTTLILDTANNKITVSAKDTIFTHPTHPSKTSGLYKVTIDGTGHVSAATAVTKADITNLGIPAQDTKYTHLTTSGNKHIPAGGSSGQILQWSADGTATWADPHKQLKYIYKCTSDTGWSISASGGFWRSEEIYCPGIDYADHIFIKFASQNPDTIDFDVNSALAAKKAFECVNYVRKYATSSIRLYCYTEKPSVSFDFYVYAIQ